MLIDLYNQLLLMSIITGLLYLILKLFSIVTHKYFSATWHYYMYLMISTFFLIPYYSVLSTFNIFTRKAAEWSLPPVIELGPSANIISTIGTIQLPEKSYEAYSYIRLLPHFLMVGTLIFMVVVVYKNIQINRRIFKVCRTTDDRAILDMLSECKRSMGIKKDMPVYVCKYTNTPFVTGLFRPRIVLPNIEFSFDELCYIFKHELTHIKKYDAWIKLLLLFINAVHWFNPFAYMIRRDVDRSSELSCDESIVISMNDKERRRYCELLLGVLWNVAEHHAKLFSAFSDKQQLERRINMIMKIGNLRNSKWSRLLAFAMTLTFLLAGAVSAYAASAKIEKSDVVQLAKDTEIKALSATNEQFISNVEESSQEIAESYGKVEIIEDTSPDFTILASFDISSSSLGPNKYTKSASSYYIVPGDKLQFSANWSPSGQKIQIGFVNKSDSSKQYWTSNYSGGSASGTVTTKSVTEGEYYVAIGTPSTNTENISVNGTFEWK